MLDSDGDGLPDSWEMARLGNTWQYDGNSDPDGEGMNNCSTESRLSGSTIIE